MATIRETTSPRDWTKEHVFELIRRSGGITRSSLVASTGLSSSTVNHAVTRLISEGRVEASARLPKGPGSGSGRPAVVLSVPTPVEWTGGIHLGPQHVRVAIGTRKGKVLDEASINVGHDEDWREAVAIACDKLEGLQQRNGVKRLAGVVAGVPRADRDNPPCSASPAEWKVVRRADHLIERFHRTPVLLCSDAALGAHAELRRGAGRAHSNFLYVKATDGVSVGLVLNGEVYHGGTGFAGEIGHLKVAGATQVCRCGSVGCLDAIVSRESLKRRIPWPLVQSAERPSRVGVSDPAATRALRETGHALGQAIAGVCDLLNPTAVVLGGTLGGSGAAFVQAVRDAIRRLAHPAVADAVVVLPAALGERAELVGALLRASELAAR